MGKERRRGPGGRGPRHDPLGAQMAAESAPARAKPKRPDRSERRGAHTDEQGDRQRSAAVGGKIEQEAHQQALEERAERAILSAGLGGAADAAAAVEVEAESGEESDVDMAEWAQDVDDDSELELDDDEAAALALFARPSAPALPTLGDVIAAKLAERERSAARQAERDSTEVEFERKCAECFRGVGQVLRHYTSGPIPKAFKLLPMLRNWEELLALTAPEMWSAPAMYHGTRIFAGSTNPKPAERFYALVLLPRVRNDIAAHKKLNFHLALALKKALSRPAAFYKGILLPLCEGGDATLREAGIIAAVLRKTSIPVLHSAAAILKLVDLPYSGPSSVFLRALLNKKYGLPARVVDALCLYFLRFMDETRVLPVLWHQSLLVFAQRYKGDIAPGRKEELRRLLRAQPHHQITPEVRREVFGRAAAEEDGAERL